MIRFNPLEKLAVTLNFRKENSRGVGGDAGEIFLAVRKIQGEGKISADGGDGSIGGKGGKITLISEDNQFQGEISAKGGKSV